MKYNLDQANQLIEWEGRFGGGQANWRFGYDFDNSRDEFDCSKLVTIEGLTRTISFCLPENLEDPALMCLSLSHGWWLSILLLCKWRALTHRVIADISWDLSKIEIRSSSSASRSFELTWSVENFLISDVHFCVRIEVPRIDWPVEPWSDKQTITFAVLDVLYPIRVAAQCSDLRLEISSIVNSDGWVIGAGCKKPIVEKSAIKKGKL